MTDNTAVILQSHQIEVDPHDALVSLMNSVMVLMVKKDSFGDCAVVSSAIRIVVGDGWLCSVVTVYHCEHCLYPIASIITNRIPPGMWRLKTEVKA